MADYENMTEDELAQARIDIDAQIAALRAEKKAIQTVVDQWRLQERLQAAGLAPINLENVGGIESQEGVGND